ncbi:MAG TPA: hypothetical protein VGC92_04365 [Phenylobacterium sp.]
MKRLAAGLAAAMMAVTAHAAPAAKTAPLPRASDGHPDLSGVWSNASVTWLDRRYGLTQLVISEAEARGLEKKNPQVMRQEADTAPADVSKPPPVGNPGGYNAFWLDPGSTFGKVRGQYRTSWIVDTPDGQLPLNAAGRAHREAAQAHSRHADVPDGPEDFEPWDRCIIASRGSGGPGMLNNIYNSNLQILQSPGFVTIEVEMIHDARAIPVFPSKAAAQAAHGPAALKPWLGDSVAWWEGATLVIETVNVNPEQGRAGPIYLTPQARVTERLTRDSAEQIFYEFTVEEPAYYTHPWHAEMSLNAGPKRLYEYACHEGNYALPDILSGRRAEEKGR